MLARARFSIGIGLFSWLAIRFGPGGLPENVQWSHLLGAGFLAGIGFTMSLFIGGLAFPGNELFIEEAKIGILAGSAISAILGYVVLRLTTTHPEEKDLLVNPEGKDRTDT